MKINMYSIKDTKLGKYCQPFVAPNNEISKRILHSTIKAGNNNIADYPEDFQLYKIGTFDEDTAELTTDTQFVANATEFAETNCCKCNGICGNKKEPKNDNDKIDD